MTKFWRLDDLPNTNLMNLPYFSWGPGNAQALSIGGLLVFPYWNNNDNMVDKWFIRKYRTSKAEQNKLRF